MGGGAIFNGSGSFCGKRGRKKKGRKNSKPSCATYLKRQSSLLILFGLARRTELVWEARRVRPGREHRRMPVRRGSWTFLRDDGLQDAPGPDPGHEL